jgi:endonuclease/exonuclease/phosphatase family metal-dependent hydrolase
MRLLTNLALVVLTTGAALGQWNPSAGQWGKSDAADLRVMTFNIRDGIRSTAVKTDADNQWHALTRIVAAFRPDVLLLQECGDLSTAVDSVANLELALDMFLYGGTDTFANPPTSITAWVQRWAPGYDLPYVHVSSVTDNYNRNVLMSRYPFADLNGDDAAVRSRLHTILPDPNVTWLPGGNDGIRGFVNAEINLPDATYAGDLVALCGHMKSGTTSSDIAERLTASKNIAYYIDYLYNGAGAGSPDPHGRILDSPPVTSVLPPLTPVVIGGDWNEDEWNNGVRGPADWVTRANIDGAPDGTDRDRGDMTYDDAREPRTNNRGTIGEGGTKFDYIAWQDSIATIRRGFIFKSQALASAPSWYPPEIATYPSSGAPNPSVIAGRASDHRTVVVDLILPLAPTLCPGDLDCDGDIDFFDIDPLVLAFSGEAAYLAVYPDCQWLNGDTDSDGDVDFFDIDPFIGLLGGTCP